MRLDWNELHFFLVIAEEGSLSAAARKLGLSQPTLSRRLGELEADLGFDLFARIGGALMLTQRGEDLLEHIRGMRDQVFAIERRLAAETDQDEALVTVSVPGVVTSRWLFDHIKAFNRSNPQTRIELHAEWDVADLLRREADIAVRMFRPTQADLRMRKVVTVDVGYYASKDYLAQAGTPETIEALEGHSMVLPSEKLVFSGNARHLAEPPAANVDVALRLDSFYGLVEAAAQGLGIAPCPAYASDIDPNLVRVLPDVSVLTKDIWLVAHSELARNRHIRAVYDFLGSAFDRDQALFQGQLSQNTEREIVEQVAQHA